MRTEARVKVSLVEALRGERERSPCRGIQVAQHEELLEVQDQVEEREGELGRCFSEIRGYFGQQNTSFS